jgi:hypothetical protein
VIRGCTYAYEQTSNALAISAGARKGVEANEEHVNVCSTRGFAISAGCSVTAAARYGRKIHVGGGVVSLPTDVLAHIDVDEREGLQRLTGRRHWAYRTTLLGLKTGILQAW